MHGGSSAPAPLRTVDEFVEGLCDVPEADFTLPNIHRYLRENPVDPESLQFYLFWEPTHYTRNLIYRCDLFELLAICWEVGQVSRIHNHQGQNCWMAVPLGRLVVQNYEVVREDPRSRACELREADRVVMDPGHPSCVDPARPVHAVINPAEQKLRAASLHVYSRPYDRCLVYSLEKQSYSEVPLFYDTEYGRPGPGTVTG